MGRKKVSPDIALTRKVETRITEGKYQELLSLLKISNHPEMSGLIRDILLNRVIRTSSHDGTFDQTMEMLSAIRNELRAIGVNINQITRFFNSYPDARRKEFYAKTAFRTYLEIDSRVNQLLQIVSKVAQKWLSK